MKDALKWGAVAVAVLGVVVTATWLYRDEHWRREIALSGKDTVIAVAPYTLPPPALVVTPNPAPAQTKPDGRVDSLLSQIANRDSLIRALASTAWTRQDFMSKDPTGLAVSGVVSVLYSPLDREFSTALTLDSIRIPVTTVTVTQTILEERVAWEWIAGAGAVGIIVGSMLAQ